MPKIKIERGIKFLLDNHECTVDHQVEMLRDINNPKKGLKKIDNYRITGHPQYEYASSRTIREGVKQNDNLQDELGTDLDSFRRKANREVLRKVEW
jgi:hypothetical protein